MLLAVEAEWVVLVLVDGREEDEVVVEGTKRIGRTTAKLLLRRSVVVGAVGDE